MVVVEKIVSNKNKPYSEKGEKNEKCVKISETERDNLRFLVKEREIAQKDSRDYYYFIIFFIILLLIGTVVLLVV